VVEDLANDLYKLYKVRLWMRYSSSSYSAARACWLPGLRRPSGCRLHAPLSHQQSDRLHPFGVGNRVIPSLA
jgi:hypothetical protein